MNLYFISSMTIVWKIYLEVTCTCCILRWNLCRIGGWRRHTFSRRRTTNQRFTHRYSATSLCDKGGSKLYLYVQSPNNKYIKSLTKIKVVNITIWLCFMYITLYYIKSKENILVVDKTQCFRKKINTSIFDMYIFYHTTNFNSMPLLLD